MSLEFQLMVNFWRKLSEYEYLANQRKLISLGIIGKNELFDVESV